MIKICNHELSSDQRSQLSGGLSFVLSKNPDPLTSGVELFKFFFLKVLLYHRLTTPQRKLFVGQRKETLQKLLILMLASTH